MKNRDLVLAALVLVLATSARALEWKKTELLLVAEPGAEFVRTKFEFTNTAKKSVHVLGVATSCGCTEAWPSTSDVPAGGSGALHVLFAVRQRSGLQENEIVVTTDESKEPMRLVLKIKLPAAPAAAAGSQ